MPPKRRATRTTGKASERVPAKASPRKPAPAGKTAKAAAKPPAVRDDRGKRLLDLVVMLLGARQPVPYREIRAQFKAYRTENEEAGLRAFERDKADLLELGVPLRYLTPDDDDGLDEAGYVVDLRRYRLPEIHLTPDEVAALMLAGSVARAAPGTTYAEVVDLALKKLAFDAPPAPDTPGSPTPPAGRSPGREPVLVHFPRPADVAELTERLAEIEQAIRWRKRITAEYTTSSTGEIKKREIDPYGLVCRQGQWLLVGHDHLRDKVLSFRLDRFGAMAVAPKPKSPDFERPAGFDVREYSSRSPWRFEVEPPQLVELDVLPAASAVASEDFGADVARTPLPGGGTRVRFTCTNPEFVVQQVLEHKGGLVVRAPEALRARVRAELAAVAARYAP